MNTKKEWGSLVLALVGLVCACAMVMFLVAALAAFSSMAGCAAARPLVLPVPVCVSLPPPEVPKILLVAPPAVGDMVDEQLNHTSVVRTTATTDSWVNFGDAIIALEKWSAKTWESCRQPDKGVRK